MKMERKRKREVRFKDEVMKEDRGGYVHGDDDIEEGGKKKAEAEAARVKRVQLREEEKYREYGGVDMAADEMAVVHDDDDDDDEDNDDDDDGSDVEGSKKKTRKAHDYKEMLDTAVTIEDFTAATEAKRKYKRKHAQGYDDDDEDEDGGNVDGEEQRERKEVRRVQGEEDEEVEGDYSGGEIVDEDGNRYTEDGIRIEAFNLREERKLGRFDESGGFVWSKGRDEEGERDVWLETLHDSEIYMGKGDGERKMNNNDNDDDEIQEDLDTLRERLVSYMKPSESVLEAIGRLGGSGSTTNKRRGHHQHHDDNSKRRKRMPWEEVDSYHDREGEEISEEERRRRKEAIEAMTHCAVKMMEAGDTNIYEETRESLKRAIERNRTTTSEGRNYFGGKSSSSNSGGGTVTQSRSNNNDDGVRWEYKWSERDDDVVYGPYSTSDMQAWNVQGYFVSNPLVRKVGGEEEGDLMGDLDDLEGGETSSSSGTGWMRIKDVNIFN